jgi:ATP-grasp domain
MISSLGPSLESKKSPLVLLATTVPWSLSARLAVRLLGYGCRVVAVCPQGHVLAHVSGLERLYRYRPSSPTESLEEAIRDAAPDFIVPCDDRVVWQLHEIHGWRPDLRALIEGSIGSAAEYGMIRDRQRLLEAARSLGVRIPQTRAVRSEKDIQSWFSDGASAGVLKRDDSWGGEGVRMAYSEAEAVSAYRDLHRLPGLLTACKRTLVNGDPMAFWEWRRRSPPQILIQTMISGQPVTAMLACWHGELLGVVGVEVLVSQGMTGAALVVRVIDHPQLTSAARSLAERLKMTGFCGLDFIRESNTGDLYLLELNPRTTQLGHLPLTERGDLAGLLYMRLAGSSTPPPQERIPNDVVAFFPQTIQWSPESSYLRTGYHDVPRDQPALVSELLRAPWADRQLSAQVYHRLFPRRKVSALETVRSRSTTET